MNSKEWKKLLSLDEQTSAVIGGHFGASGNKIDNPFAGPFTGTPNVITPLKKRNKPEWFKIEKSKDKPYYHGLGLPNETRD